MQLAHSPLVISDEEIEIFCKNCQTLGQICTSSIEEELGFPADLSTSALSRSPSDSRMSPACPSSASSSSSSEKIKDALENDLFDDDSIQTPLLYYLLIRAMDSFHLKYARYPGSTRDNSGCDHDAKELFNEVQALIEKMNLPKELISFKQCLADGDDAMDTDDENETSG
jgi:hypothetical protein